MSKAGKKPEGKKREEMTHPHYRTRTEKRKKKKEQPEEEAASESSRASDS